MLHPSWEKVDNKLSFWLFQVNHLIVIELTIDKNLGSNFQASRNFFMILGGWNWYLMTETSLKYQRDDTSRRTCNSWDTDIKGMKIKLTRIMLRVTNFIGNILLIPFVTLCAIVFLRSVTLGWFHLQIQKLLIRLRLSLESTFVRN